MDWVGIQYGNRHDMIDNFDDQDRHRFRSIAWSDQVISVAADDGKGEDRRDLGMIEEIDKSRLGKRNIDYQSSNHESSNISHLPCDTSPSAVGSTTNHHLSIQLHISSRAELTIQGRGHSTTDDSSTLPSHQEESEGCESFFQFSNLFMLFCNTVTAIQRCRRCRSDSFSPIPDDT